MNPDTNTPNQPPEPQNQNGAPPSGDAALPGQPAPQPQGGYQSTVPTVPQPGQYQPPMAPQGPVSQPYVTAPTPQQLYGQGQQSTVPAAIQAQPYQSPSLAQTSQTQPYQAVPPAAPAGLPPQKNPLKNKKLLFGVGGILLLLIIAGSVFFVIKNRSVPTVDEATFQKNLVSCTRSITYAPKDEGFGTDTSFKINGRSGSGCGVEVHIGKSTNPNDILKKIENTSMKCVISKEDAAATEIFMNPDKYNCKGTMVAALKDFQKSLSQ